MSEPVSVVKLCPKCGSENPDEAAYCLKCGSPLEVQSAEEDEVMSKLSPLEQATTKGLSREKCRRYRAPAMVLSLISGVLVLVVLFAINVHITFGSDSMLEIETDHTPYYLISEMGANSQSFEGVLSPMFWITVLLAVFGIVIPLLTALSCFVGAVMMFFMSRITVDAPIFDVYANVTVIPSAVILTVIMFLAIAAIYCNNMYGVQFRTKQGKSCIQEYIPFC